MAKHVIRVQYLESEGTIDNIDFSVRANNLSSEALNDLTNVNVYTNGFLLNLSDLSGNYEYYNKSGLKYYISSVFSDSNNNIDISLFVTSTNAKAISLVFSKEYYPTKISVNGVEYENTNDIFQIFIDQTISNATTTIRFLEMNLPNVPLIITNINTGISIDYDDNYIISWIRGSELSTDNTLPKYEFIGQYGSCSFIDNDYVVLNLKTQGILRKPKKVEFLLDENVVGIYKVDSWDYNTSNNVVNIELIDSIDETQDILIEPQEAKFMHTSQLSDGTTIMYTANDLFNDIKTKLESFGETFDEIDEVFIEWISNIGIKILKYNATNLNDLVVAFCNLTQTTFYKKSNGKIGVYLWQ